MINKQFTINFDHYLSFQIQIYRKEEGSYRCIFAIQKYLLSSVLIIQQNCSLNKYIFKYASCILFWVTRFTEHDILLSSIIYQYLLIFFNEVNFQIMPWVFCVCDLTRHSHFPVSKSNIQSSS